jgi:hypothetical protein
VTTETKVEAVAWQQRIRYWSGAPWGEWQTFKSKPDRDASWQPYRGSEWQRETRELVDASAITALEGEVADRKARHERTERDACMWASRAEAAEKRADAAERRVAELEGAISGVVLAFEQLGEAKGIVAERSARRACEATMVAMKNALTKETP